MKFPPMLWGVIALIFCTTGICAAESDELDREIARLNKEITRVQSQRSDEAKQVKKEKAEYQAYRERTASRISAVNRQTDSIKSVLQQTLQRNDSLRARLAAINTKIREQELLVQKVRSVIVNALKKLQVELPNLPPLVREQYSGPVGYLTAELEAGSAENTEALYRVMRMVQDLRTVSQEIQVVEGASPVPQLRGSVYRLRIGAVFEAVVDNAGEKAFVWVPMGENADSLWIPAGNADVAASILKAVKIREGKTVPDLVDIPVGMRMPGGKESDDEK